MTLEIRTVTESEFPDWLRAVSTGFLRPPVFTDAQIAGRREVMDLARTHGAYDEGRWVATYRMFEQRLSVVGGGQLSASAVTNVSVSPTHRRRGLLSRLMSDNLAVARERGDAVSTLIASEYPIYGRYGFGPAARTTQWSVDVPRTGLDPRWSGPGDGGRIDMVDGSDVRKLGPELHARVAAGRAGLVSRDDRWWLLNTGKDPAPLSPWTEPFYAVYRSPAGEVEGLLAYEADDHWGDAKQPLNTAKVRELLAATPAAERALWHFVCSVDWITTVKSGHRAPDDLLPDLLPDPRAARVETQADFMWVRILDVVRALEARTYDASATLVLEVRDRLGLAGGRFRLETGPQGVDCAPTDDAPDLSLDVSELGALYLGDASPVRLLALGALEEHRAGAALTAERMFRTPRLPWCPDIF
ncbi:GNAT family N-acetyltransferase [Streptomyces sp. NPDC020965]|uniref:GNAT family N-acetyltransferase n=1 Tax=Streptomyces sp. NPDC020965 TaxID=3365105 RepID=UPI0037ABEB2D